MLIMLISVCGGFAERLKEGLTKVLDEWLDGWMDGRTDVRTYAWMGPCRWRMNG